MYCFGFFTDALDEYDGDHGGLVLMMENVCTRTNVKFYVSSQPLNTFGAPSDRYGPARQLKVEDFAISDMENYISSRLFADNKFKKLLWSDTYSVESVQNLVNRADGVFLFYFLGTPCVQRTSQELP